MNKGLYQRLLAGWLLVCLALPLYAQGKGGLSKKMLRSMRRQQPIVRQMPQASSESLSRSVEQAARQAAQAQGRPVGSTRVRQNLAEAEKAVSALFRGRGYRASRDPVMLLDDLWKEQNNFEQVSLFPIFIRKYYNEQFGDMSPHVEMFINKMNEITDQDIQQQVTQRFYFLAQNKYTLGAGVQPAHSNRPLSRNAFRIRYAKDINQLTADNFDPDNLILSIERRMSPNPADDFPIRHISRRTEVKIGQQTLPIFFYSGSLDNLSSFYRFLLNGSKRPHDPITYVLDREEKALAVFNHDRSLWLRVTEHEFSTPERLHVHLNEFRHISFIDQDGNDAQELINLNLSIPLAMPRDLPKHNKKDFLFRKMILEPVKASRQDAHVIIQRGPIW
ncbi:MAG: hypothetical protein MJ053_00905 [Elusimicrobiaceae bacterium]|nr:hypothetical protein [Elusimicrobiaceae bacterium]